MPRDSTRNDRKRLGPTYPVERDGATIEVGLPFVVGVLGDFSGTPAEPLRPLKDRKFLQIDLDNFDKVLAACAPRLPLRVENSLTGDGGEFSVELRFRSFDDFLPANVARQFEPLRRLLDVRDSLLELTILADCSPRFDDFLARLLTDEPSPDRLAAAWSRTTDGASAPVERLARLLGRGVGDAEGSRIEEALEHLVRRVEDGSVVWVGDAIRSLERAIRDVDLAVSRQLAHIMSHPAFLTLEGTWRGLRRLVEHRPNGRDVKIRILNVTKRELLADADRAVDPRQSSLFKKIHTEEFDQLGGEPFGLLVGDYEFGASPDDLRLLDRIAEAAEAAFCPFVAAASPRLFDMNSWDELPNPRSLGRIFDSADHARWNSFRESDRSKFVGLALPRVLARAPYRAGGGEDVDGGFRFEEFDGDGPVDGARLVWTNPAYVLAANWMRAFADDGHWLGIEGFRRGGLIEGLPTFSFETEEGDRSRRGPAEVEFWTGRGLELADLGFLALIRIEGTDGIVSPLAPSIHKPARYDDPDVEAAERLVSRFPAILTISRFVHHLNRFAGELRDQEPGWLEIELNHWLKRFVSPAPPSPDDMRRPLREAIVSSEPRSGSEVVRRLILTIRPWFPREDMGISTQFILNIATK